MKEPVPPLACATLVSLVSGSPELLCHTMPRSVTVCPPSAVTLPVALACVGSAGVLGVAEVVLTVAAPQVVALAVTPAE